MPSHFVILKITGCTFLSSYNRHIWNELIRNNWSTIPDCSPEHNTALYLTTVSYSTPSQTAWVIKTAFGIGGREIFILHGAQLPIAGQEAISRNIWLDRTAKTHKARRHFPVVSILTCTESSAAWLCWPITNDTMCGESRAHTAPQRIRVIHANGIMLGKYPLKCGFWRQDYFTCTGLHMGNGPFSNMHVQSLMR